VEAFAASRGSDAQTVVCGAALVLESRTGTREFSCGSGVDGGSSDGGTAQDLCQTNRAVAVAVLGMSTKAPSVPLEGAIAVERRGFMLFNP
jgi:hypothetical protein